jgi:glutamate-ammonia-ligase adenylyltransferase
MLSVILATMVNAKADGAAAHADLAALERCLGPMAHAAIRLVSEHAPDERLALAFLLRLAEQARYALVKALSEPQLARDLVFCLGSSELIGTHLSAAGDAWLDMFCEARAHDLSSFVAGLRFDLDQINDLAQYQAALKEAQRREFFKIAVGDLLRRFSVVDTMTAMSALADRCVEAALAGAVRLNPKHLGAKVELCVLALGKLGAGELNLSSDLDLAYLFDAAPDSGSVDPGADHEERMAATRLAELVTELLRGAGFRVDLRLRPGGRFAPLVTSLEGALAFYESLGQTWERAVLLRARPIAGSRARSEWLLGELERFIYRRYSDFDTLSQLRAMKSQIELEMGSADMITRNIKLGRGGIRELEFIVQALTLVYGGRDPRIRTPRTLEALERLARCGYIAAERAHELTEAYLFLRDVEHKLQVAAGLQSHTMPANPAARAIVAARMGMGKGAQAAGAFEQVLARHRERVAATFGELLGGAEKTQFSRVSRQAQQTWLNALEPELSASGLKALGFANPIESAGQLVLLARGPEHALATPRRRELLRTLGPLLLDEIRTQPDPDLALANLAQFIAAVGARTSFLALLEAHEPTRRALLRLFASSQYLSALFIRHPELLDTLVRSDLARLSRSGPELAQELEERLSACSDYESRLDAMRSFRHQEFLRVAIADLSSQISLADVQRELSILAETMLQFALKVAQSEVSARLPIAQDVALAIIAMGRLGAAEMSYNSDLDLIFVYEPAGANPLLYHEAATKVVQRLISVLETKTREGYVYKLDLRLRPSGNAGPLVTSLDGWREYYRDGCAVWERQALVKARAVAGEMGLRKQVEACREAAAFSLSLSSAQVEEIQQMRARMEREISPETVRSLNLKQGRGGLVDVEFLTQMLALRYGQSNPELRRERATPRLLDALARAALIDSAQAELLKSHYGFLSLLEHRLRIQSDQPASAISTDPSHLTALARRMGFDGADGARRLLDELEYRRSQVREIFLARFAEEKAREVPPATSLSTTAVLGETGGQSHDTVQRARSLG